MKMRLGPLPKTNTVKMTISVSMALKEQLDRYAELHAATWHEPVEAEKLIPHILEQFIARDKAFKAMLRQAPSTANKQGPR